MQIGACEACTGLDAGQADKAMAAVPCTESLAVVLLGSGCVDSVWMSRRCTHACQGMQMHGRPSKQAAPAPSVGLFRVEKDGLVEMSMHMLPNCNSLWKRHRQVVDPQHTVNRSQTWAEAALLMRYCNAGAAGGAPGSTSWGSHQDADSCQSQGAPLVNNMFETLQAASAELSMPRV